MSGLYGDRPPILLLPMLLQIPHRHRINIHSHILHARIHQQRLISRLKILGCGGPRPRQRLRIGLVSLAKGLLLELVVVLGEGGGLGYLVEVVAVLLVLVFALQCFQSMHGTLPPLRIRSRPGCDKFGRLVPVHLSLGPEELARLFWRPEEGFVGCRGHRY
jgi:hypothetical protein